MKKIFLAAALLIFSGLAFAQTVISYNGSGNFTLRERTDLRRYDNGKYVGLVSREVSSFIIPAGSSNGYLYEGSFFVHQGIKRAMRSIAPEIDEAIPSVFSIGADGQFKMIEDNGYPSFRSFPTFPNKSIKPGDSWTGKGERSVDPLDKGIPTKMPFYVEYTYQKDDELNGEPIFVITARWATRYGMGSGTYYIDYGGDKDLSRAEGSHNATLYISKATGNMLIMRDNVDETYLFSDGNKIQFKGTVALFTEYPPAIDRTKIYRDIRTILAGNKTSDKSSLVADSSKSKVSTKTSSDKANVSDKSTSSSKKETISSAAKTQTSSAKTNTDSSSKTGSTSAAKTESVTSAKTESLASAKATTTSGTKTTETASTSDTTLAAANSKKIDSDTDYSDLTMPYVDDMINEYIEEIDIDIEETAAGIKLAIRNLQFKPNSPELEDGENARLDQIAQVLNTTDARLLVEGHTARTGIEEGEQELSEERARAVAQALSERGVKIGRFICKGWGGRKPIDTNDTTEGRARNRRVEITILD